MRANSLSTFGRVVAAPWQQRVNQSGLWLSLLLPALIVLPMLLVGGLMVVSLGGDQRFAARVFVCVFAIAGVASVWAMTVNSLVDQNNPTLARLVPGHAAALRRALFAGGAVLLVCGGVLPGIALGSPFSCTGLAAIVLAAFALLVRWPQGGFVVMALAAATPWLLRTEGRQVAAWWHADSPVDAAVFLAVAAALLLTIVRRGDAAHVAAYAGRRQRRARSQARLQGDTSADLACGGTFSWTGRPYFWWLRRQLARPDSPVQTRLLMGLGPSLHWTTRLSTMLMAALGFSGGCLVAYLTSPDMGKGMLTGASIGVLFAIAAPALQVQTALWRNRGEQALLVLLPGVPQGGQLNRWLGARMSVHFGLGLLGAFSISLGMRVLARALAFGWNSQDMDNAALMSAAALLPLGQLVWRRWHLVSAPTGLTPFVPLLWAVVAGATMVALHLLADIGVGALAAGGFAVSMLWCALRWRQAGREPSHLPLGRSAR